MLKRTSTSGKTANNALSIAAAALLALALGVGANSGIVGLSQFTPANKPIFCRESRPLAGRQLIMIRDALPQAPQEQSAEPTQSTTTLLNRCIFAGRF